MDMCLKNVEDTMKNLLFFFWAVIFLSLAAIAHGEEFNVVCGLKEDLNFKSSPQVIYLKVDLENKTVNGIPSTVYGDDIITYETKNETLTFVLPSMYLQVVRKGRGPEGADIIYR